MPQGTQLANMETQNIWISIEWTLSLTFEHFSAEKKHIYLIRYVMKTYPGQPPTLAQLPAQQRKIRQKFEYFLAGWAIASNEDMTQVGYCLGLKSSARPRGWSLSHLIISLHSIFTLLLYLVLLTHFTLLHCTKPLSCTPWYYVRRPFHCSQITPLRTT